MKTWHAVSPTPFALVWIYIHYSLSCFQYFNFFLTFLHDYYTVDIIYCLVWLCSLVKLNKYFIIFYSMYMYMYAIVYLYHRIFCAGTTSPGSSSPSSPSLWLSGSCPWTRRPWWRHSSVRTRCRALSGQWLRLWRLSGWMQPGWRGTGLPSRSSSTTRSETEVILIVKYFW